MVVTALAITAVPAYAEAKLVLSAASGPSAGGNTITGQAPTTGTAPFLATTPPVVQFQAITTSVTTCSLTYKAVAPIAGASNVLTAGVQDAVTVTRINAYRIAVKIPVALALTGTNAFFKFNMCAYDDDITVGSTLLASAPYTIATKPTITNIAPVAGPALGGYQISVTGTGFTSGSTATLGNVPLTGVTVNTGGTLLTGTAPPRAAGTGIQLVIVSQGGTVSSNDPDNDPTNTAAPNNFTLSNGIVVTPNTATEGSTPDLDIFGVGFAAMDFSADTAAGTSPAAATPHIVLVNKSTGYDPVPANLGRPITVCTDVLVLSDTELLCKLQLGGVYSTNAADATIDTSADVPTGAYTLQVIKTGLDTGPPSAETIDATAVTSGSTFTVAPY
ncbi:hypothetical protein DMB66_37190 [Actinoplanes sp. ATCC 53533]|nr:hypothetical protein DMB66_37190 [Actinoplanes sp. ATCC 53533]